MPRTVALLSTLAMLAACATRAPVVNTSTDAAPEGVVQYRCESGERFAARIQGTSAMIQYNGATYTLPQLSNVAGVQSYSDGRHVLEIRQGRTWFGLGRSAPRQCVPQ